MSSTRSLPSLIAYIVSQLLDMDATFGKTKLVKLLYLVDIENWRWRSHKLTGLEWVFLHYGPYAREIDTALRQLDLDLPQEEVITQAGYRAIVFRPTRDLPDELEQYFSDAERVVVDDVLRQWGMDELNPLLSYVYFHTEPMQDAHRGEVLDFSKIQRLPTWRPAQRSVELPADRLQELRTQFQRLKRQRVRDVAKSLDPRPRFDEVFRRGLQRLNEEERYSVPTGSVELSEELKRQLREEGIQETGA